MEPLPGESFGLTTFPEVAEADDFRGDTFFAGADDPGTVLSDLVADAVPFPPGTVRSIGCASATRSGVQ